jgi:hypothetical protein
VTELVLSTFLSDFCCACSIVPSRKDIHSLLAWGSTWRLGVTRQKPPATRREEGRRHPNELALRRDFVQITLARRFSEDEINALLRGS